MVGNVIPYIGGEEEKSEKEPLKVWGQFAGDHIELAQKPVISAQCYRVAVQEGHTAAVSVSFENKPSKEEMIEVWKNYESEAVKLGLPSAPKHFLQYIEEDNRPQPQLDANFENGMGVSVARLREDNIFDYKFCCLSHNTLRGAAGGAARAQRPSAGRSGQACRAGTERDDRLGVDLDAGGSGRRGLLPLRAAAAVLRCHELRGH